LTKESSGSRRQSRSGAQAPQASFYTQRRAWLENTFCCRVELHLCLAEEGSGSGRRSNRAWVQTPQASILSRKGERSWRTPSDGELILFQQLLPKLSWIKVGSSSLPGRVICGQRRGQPGAHQTLCLPRRFSQAPCLVGRLPGPPPCGRGFEPHGRWFADCHEFSCARHHCAPLCLSLSFFLCTCEKTALVLFWGLLSVNLNRAPAAKDNIWQQCTAGLL
jgi:hypothetical protein